MTKIGKVVIIKKVRDNSDKIVSGVITAAGAFLVFKGIRKLLKNKKCEIVEKAPEELQEEFEKFKEKKKKKLIKKRRKRIRKAIAKIVIGTAAVAIGIITFTPYKEYLVDNSAVDKIKESDVVGKIKDSNVVGRIKDSDVVGKVKDKEVIAKIRALLDKTSA